MTFQGQGHLKDRKVAVSTVSGKLNLSGRQHTGRLRPERLCCDTPTSCGGNSGSITGLQVQGVQPLTFEWLNADGNVIGNDLNIFGLGVGNYSVDDGNTWQVYDSVFEGLYAGNYVVRVSDTNGCQSVYDYNPVTALWSGLPFSVPNAFSPNGDGLNDVFRVIPRYDYVRDFNMQIYNRWGSAYL